MYHLEILPYPHLVGSPSAMGINNSGFVAGGIAQDTPSGELTSAAIWPISDPGAYTTWEPGPGWFWKINDAGDAIGYSFLLLAETDVLTDLSLIDDTLLLRDLNSTFAVGGTSVYVPNTGYLRKSFMYDLQA